MPTNAGFEYQRLEKEYPSARTFLEKIAILQKMLEVGPKHKGAEKLRNDIKKKIAKYKGLLDREKRLSKGGNRGGLSIKKEGAARIVLIGATNTGKSTLLSRITNAKPEIAEYEHTTRKPEIATMDYHGVMLQVIEMPAITKDYLEKEKGPAYLGVVRDSDLIVIVSRSRDDIKLIKEELEEAGIPFNGIIVNSMDNNVKERIWNKLGLIYVYTKSPGKNKDYPPIALNKKANVRDLALNVHKDFVRRFDYARVWGKSARFSGQRVGLNHILQEEDVIELHLK
ncbi:TGS domain-containing protein [Candidatus Woesearchaeota archaeon]|nr:TGS domain-containing protein [Candidatus Woesearchaeota archaeon]